MKPEHIKVNVAIMSIMYFHNGKDQEVSKATLVRTLQISGLDFKDLEIEAICKDLPICHTKTGYFIPINFNEIQWEVKFLNDNFPKDQATKMFQRILNTYCHLIPDPPVEQKELFK